ncbi:hypothetical protein ACFLYP_00385 [Chloroflexota bacterium]
MKRLIPLLLIVTILMPSAAMAAPRAGAELSVKVPNGGPTFWIHDVKRDEEVTISVINYPKEAKWTYQVLLGYIGNEFGFGTQVGLLTGELGKEFTISFEIPNKFKGEKLIGIKLRRNADGAQGYTMFANLDGWNSTKPLSLVPVEQASSQTVGTSVAIFQGPTYWIERVVPQDQFTIRLSHWTDTDKYKVFIGVNNADYQPFWVGTIEDVSSRKFSRTFDIPIQLRKAEELKVVLEGQYSGHSGATAFTHEKDFKVVHPFGSYTWTYINSASRASSGGTPFTTILNVVQNTEVTLQTFNFPPDMDFAVTMGPIGTRGIGGILLGTQNSGDGGSFIATYPIPGQLFGQETIAIRFQSTTTEHFSYDFFQNSDGYNYNSFGTSFEGDWVLPPGTYPYTLVIDVDQDNLVTISGFNFTKNDTYIVTMGPMGTKGVGGIQVRTFVIDGSGTFTENFKIPEGLKGVGQIAIRFESVNTEYFAYDWFWNQ